MYFSEQGNVDDDATLITIVFVSFNLQSCCLMQSAVYKINVICTLLSHGCCAKSGSPWTSQTLNLHQAIYSSSTYTCKSLKLRIKMKNICKKKRLPSVSYGELHQPWPYALQHQCFQPSLWFQQQM